MKKNLAIVIPQLAGGGAERVASNLSLYLSDEKYNKFIIVYDNERVDYPYNGKLINLDIKASANPLGKIINFIRRINKLNKIKKEYGIDTTISMLSGPNLINILTKKTDKVIVSVRNFPSKTTIGLVDKLLIKLLYNKADLVVAVSKAIKNDLVKNFGIDKDKIKIIYNAYDKEKIRELSLQAIEEKYKEIFNYPTIITVGRLEEQKGHWHLIRAFKRVKEEIPEVKLVIIGQGGLEGYLKNLTIELKLDKDVFFLGFKNNPFKYIKKSTLYVFPSLYEGFPNALCEAMACSRPVISSNCKSGPIEILAPNKEIDLETEAIDHEMFGILVPTCDGIKYEYDYPLTNEEEILYKSIIESLGNEDILQKYSVKSLERVSHFNIKEIMKGWEDEI
jgi:glycosyltransferase involved in cell wall biosynthesis